MGYIDVGGLLVGKLGIVNLWDKFYSFNILIKKKVCSKNNFISLILFIWYVCVLNIF